ncbi:MAG TPA: CBS domain-containing protein [Planctomycetota bacterium]|nr:CBS domain-containing protein [Planctomycetota bacterium]
MTLLKEVMSRHFETLDPDTAMTEALKKLESQNLSQLLVCRNDRVVGVLEEYDLRRRILDSGCDPAQTPVRRFMSSNVLSGFEEQEVKDLVSPMRRRNVHAIPVLNRESRMVGLFTLGGPWKRAAPERTG